ncbi:flagellar type III secretion system protein FlhB [Roseitranquillus sediminis]|uniref:flagellar type III secretion system protein FlhB n=1 Tax=Roseitranquillus sediminis TaxID=2809051 RepID=UPI001D0CA6B8|nr:flagellar type III secretion system protein FlhB [Roseitranquillus sediminis]MBM9596128.1 flagellar biosynthesis protein FlhB [Roseitranquillus sediminis]
MAEEEDEDKQYEPSQKKLDDARKKGEVPRSADLTTAASYAGMLIASAGLGGGALIAAGEALATLIDRPDMIAADIFAGGGGGPFVGGLMGAVVMPLVPFFLVPAALAVVAIVATRSFTVTPDKLQPKLNRISPLAQAKNKFGRSGLFEFAKSFVKLMIFGVVLGFYLAARLPEIMASMALSPAMATADLLRMSIGFLFIVLAVSLAIGAIDFLWQRAEHLRKNRMSRKEMTDEHKESEGDPHMKQQRRQRGYEIAMNQMLADVPQADVVIVNPTHYAVALKWSRAKGTAPTCVAKGVDEIARRIREVAAEHAIAIHSDPPTARALHATVEIGEEIRPEHYRAVAAAIRFAEAMRKKARRR